MEEYSPVQPHETHETRTILKRFTRRLVFLVVVVSLIFGFFAGVLSSGFVYVQLAGRVDGLGERLSLLPERAVEKETIAEKEYLPQTSQEQRVIDVVETVSPAVVSIVITKDIPVVERFFSDPFEDFFGPSPFQFQIPEERERGTERREVGGGSGFIVSEDGLVVTNKHVVLEDDAEYTVFTNEGKSYTANVLARDPIQDLAIIQINHDGVVFPHVQLGDSDGLRSGQTVVAIGNALGEFRNTVSVGVISGLGRTITASDGIGSFVETIEDVIQTDAAINRGNSGGPLLNLAGEVIGVNTATVLQAQSIGFAIPVNKAKRDIQQVEEFGRIVYPFLGVRYILITERLQEQEGLPVDYGVILRGSEDGEPAISPDSAAEKAGLKAGDIILELDGEKITAENTLATLIQQFNPGDTVSLKIMRAGSIITLTATLGERSE